MHQRMMEKIGREPHAQSPALQLERLILMLACYQIFLHGYFVIEAQDPRLLLPHLIAGIHDMALLGLLSVAGLLLLRWTPLRIKAITSVCLRVGCVLCGMALASYPRFLREYLVFPVNLFEADIQTTTVLVSDYLGAAALWPVLFALLFGLGSMFLKSRVRLPRKLALLLPGFVLIITALTLQRPSPHPLLFSLQQQAEALFSNQPRVVPSLKRPSSLADSIHQDVNDGITAAASVTNYRHLLLLVLEGITSQEFEQEFLKIPDGFYAQHKDHAVYFERYYATNLDSYTSLIAMLTAIQTPYRAYADSSLYERVNDAMNLTGILRSQGWHTAFFSTYQYQPFVPTRAAWNDIFDMTNLPVDGTWISLGTSKMEAATEDKAALPTLVATVRQHEHAFVLHELVYGHSPAWRAATGKTTLQYYDEYLRDLIRMLSEEDLVKDSLVVVVSDHGDRAKAADADNYRVPLLVVGEHIQAQRQSEMFNHLDLPQLILHYGANTRFPEPRNQVVVVGSTEKWIYGTITNDGDFLFINDSRGTVMSQDGNITPSDVQHAFQTRLNEFARHFGQ